MLKWIAFLALIVAVVLSVTMLGGKGTVEDPLQNTSDPVQGSGDGGSTPLEMGTGLVNGAGGQGGAQGGDRTAIQGSGDPNEDPSGNLLTIEVRDASGKLPMGEADLWLLDRNSRPAVEWQPAFQETAERVAYVREHGTAFRTDGQGRVQVPRVSNCAVLAQTAGYRGESAWIGPAEDPVIVRMQPLPDLRIVVLDARGLPAQGVPVAVVARAGTAERRLTTQYTQASGEAGFPGLNKQLEAAGSGHEFRVELAFPQANPESQPLVPGALAGEVLELRMPPAGPMQITVVDETRKRLAKRMTLAMGQRVPGTGAGADEFRVGKRHTLNSGQLILNWVEVGHTFDVQLIGGGELADQITPVTGPPVSGPLHKVDVVWHSQHRRLTGRAVDSNGTPLRQAQGLLHVLLDGVRRDSLGIASDQDGQFELRFDVPWDPQTLRTAEIEFPDPAGGSPMQTRHDLSFEVPPGETDLGDLVFAALPFAFSGVTYDVDGNPLPLVVVGVEHDSTGSGNWVRIQGPGDSSNLDGQFRLYGEVEHTNMRLIARRKGYLPAYVPGVSLGATDLVVTVLVDPNASQDEPSDKE